MGKTTACGKLALFLKKEGKKVLMVSTDVYRPAAIDQLEMLSKKVEVDFLRLPSDGVPSEMAAEALRKAKAEKFDVLLVDTAGRLQVDDSMMAELRDIQVHVRKPVSNASPTFNSNRFITQPLSSFGTC